MIVKPNGIENVVNWQDNGIFADTQKPVTDDNYTLAGDVNQDNLYVGYMKEHGLKGKLSLPVLSSLGAITGRQTIGDCEVYKHVNGTTIIKGAVINPNLPDSRISLGFSADENGLQYYNNPNDPMPIKTINMNGLQKWEETDDYIIYVDKDAVMTTVQNYVTGTYDLFLERKSQVDGAMELLKENGIEWTAEDDSKLLQDINLVQLERIASTPTTMDELTEIQTFEARAVPTTYECCFRTDKKTGEIYIGEGYENLFAVNKLVTPIKFTEIDSSYNHYKVTKIAEYVYENHGELNFPISMNLNETISVSYEVKNISITNECAIENRVSSPKIIYDFLNKKSFESNSYSFSVSKIANELFIFSTTKEFSNQQEFEFRKAQITKTSTPKPFVRSVMPGGKLSFVTNATSETHSFVMKGVIGVEQIQLATSRYDGLQSGNWNWTLPQQKSDKNYFLSKAYILEAREHDIKFPGANQCLNLVRHRGYTNQTTSFKQFLIYKGNLTESELKAENEKEINVGAYYHQENSVPLTYGIDSMKAMRVYSPALTDIEIAEEVNKNIYIPENRDGVPNYIGEVK